MDVVDSICQSLYVLHVIIDVHRHPHIELASYNLEWNLQTKSLPSHKTNHTLNYSYTVLQFIPSDNNAMSLVYLCSSVPQLCTCDAGYSQGRRHGCSCRLVSHPPPSTQGRPWQGAAHQEHAQPPWCQRNSGQLAALFPIR